MIVILVPKNCYGLQSCSKDPYDGLAIVRQANSKQWEEFRNSAFSDFGTGSHRNKDCLLEVSISNQQFQYPKPVCLYLVVQT